MISLSSFLFFFLVDSLFFFFLPVAVAVATMKGLRKDEIKIEAQLSATGGFGLVYRGVVRGSTVAIKIPRNALSEKQIKDFTKEVAILSSVFHPNICLFLGAYVGQQEVIIVNELMEGNVGELLANKNLKISMTQRLRMNEDAARGIAWLHGSDIVHRDLKPSNYLYKRLGERQYQVKVCDFGLSDLSSTGSFVYEQKPKGTPLYMAPEVLMSQALNEKVDVYSFAITLWEMVTGQEPFAQVTSVESLVRLVCKEHARPPIPPTWGSSLQRLVSACWMPMPDQRPKFEEICSRLGDVLVESSIQDPAGQLFWKTCFLGRENVPFDEFAERFFGQFAQLRGKVPRNDETAVMSGYVGEVKKGTVLAGSRPLNAGGLADSSDVERAEHAVRVHLLRLLKLLFVDDASPDNEVNCEFFGQCLQWLGPIEATDPYAFFFRVQKLYSKSWFFGGIRTQDAASLLLTKPPGTFLVRFCNNPDYPGFFVLSVVTVSGSGTVVAHVRIRHSPGGPFSLEKIANTGSYATLEELIEGCGTKLNLRKPPPRKYEYAVWEACVDEMSALEMTLREAAASSADSRKDMAASGGGVLLMDMSAEGEI